MRRGGIQDCWTVKPEQGEIWEYGYESYWLVVSVDWPNACLFRIGEVSNAKFRQVDYMFQNTGLAFWKKVA